MLELEHALPDEKDLQISMDPKDRSGNLLLSNVKDEIEHLAKELGFQLHKCADQISDTDVMDYIFNGNRAHWLLSLKDRMDHELLAMDKERLAENELFNFLEFVIACHYYGKSPSILADSSYHQVDNFGKPRLLSLKRLEELLKALSYMKISHSDHEDKWTSEDKLLQSLRTSFTSLSTQMQRIAYSPGNTIISLDDDKLRHRGTEASALNVSRSFQKGLNKGLRRFEAYQLMDCR